jgi:hypothetical protein
LVVESVDFDEEEGHPTSDDNGATATPAHHPAPNTFAIFKGGGAASNATKEGETETKETNQSVAGEHPKPNIFGGLGAALNNSMKQNNKKGIDAAVPRNRFALFNPRNNDPSAKQVDSKGAGRVNHFAGLNQLRKTTMARMNNVTEESVSFDQTPPGTTATYETPIESVDAATEQVEPSAKVTPVLDTSEPITVNDADSPMLEESEVKSLEAPQIARV